MKKKDFGLTITKNSKKYIILSMAAQPLIVHLRISQPRHTLEVNYFVNAFSLQEFNFKTVFMDIEF